MTGTLAFAAFLLLLIGNLDGAAAQGSGWNVQGPCSHFSQGRRGAGGFSIVVTDRPTKGGGTVETTNLTFSRAG